MNLTKNAIAIISSSVDVVRPILQVNVVKLVNTTQSATERYRMVLSDGEHLQQAMLAAQLSVIVKEGKLMKGSIVQLNEFICNIIQGRRIIIVISLDVLVDKLDPIGDPKNFDNSSVPPQNRSLLPVMNLMKNAIAMISSSVDVVRPILQVNDVRLINTTQSATERYRMVLSDGEHLQQAMMATWLNVIVKEGKLRKGSIVQLNEFICNIIQGRRIIIVISLDVLVPQLDPIGDPKNFDNSSGPPQNRSSMPISTSVLYHQLQQQNMHSAIKSRSTSPVSQQNMMMGISVNALYTVICFVVLAVMTIHTLCMALFDLVARSDV